jgi:hypothetical protein
MACQKNDENHDFPANHCFERVLSGTCSRVAASVSEQSVTDGTIDRTFGLIPLRLRQTTSASAACLMQRWE